MDLSGDVDIEQCDEEEYGAENRGNDVLSRDSRESGMGINPIRYHHARDETAAKCVGIAEFAPQCAYDRIQKTYLTPFFSLKRPVRGRKREVWISFWGRDSGSVF